MSPTDEALDERFKVVEAVADEAAALAVQYFGRRGELDVQLKGPQDFVSDADRRVEALIRDRLLDRFPDDGFLGEEDGLRAGRSDEAGLWVVDPIDGSQPFLTGLGSWVVSIAYLQAGVVELGLVTCPVRDERFVGRRGQGATLNGTPITVSGAAGLDEGIVAFGHNPRLGADETMRIVDRLVRGGAMIHTDGSGALMLCYVASGSLIGYLEAHIKSWDCLAGLAIVEAAGGQVNEFLADGSLLGGGPVVAGTKGLYPTLSDIMAAAGPT